jgi:hypothetical protein
MTEDNRLTAPLKKVKNIRQYVFSGRTSSGLVRTQIGTDYDTLLGRGVITVDRSGQRGV